ncbi:unnamed protein product [Rotaria sp. Silwood2]|nr:unnamed protein product [Rotaria sp. Silwood2]CAF4009449.1 unnamed protein product [Rotaria sp. Silwood2]CAF4353419.1 unnamed protein product [Rotaria sp. Silwood2]
MLEGSCIHEWYLNITWLIWIYISWLHKYLLGSIKRRRHKENIINIEYLAQSIRDHETGSRIQILRNERNSPSNSVRRPSLSLTKTETMTKTKTKTTHFINLGAANQIIAIDTSSKTVTCEPGVTMEELVDALLLYNLVPAVVPEYKALTVGGILAGAGLESSSFRYGQFGDLLIEATYILSNGQIITCSPTNNCDLFYGALGACGTFGLLIQATLRVLEVKSDCFVQCNYFRTNRPMDSLASLSHHDYVDAIVFLDYTVIITGERIDNLTMPKTAKIQTFSKAWDPWYYQHIKAVHSKSSLTIITEYIPLKDYLFRYDRCAFWMGHYGIHPFQDQIQCFPRRIRNLLNLFPFGGYNILSRTLLAPIFATFSLYNRLHASPISVVAEKSLIQDVYIPKSKATEFLTYVQSGKFFMEHDGILEPIWLCPICSTLTSQKFSPHFREKDRNDDESFINFGLWTRQSNWQIGTCGARHATKALEREVMRLGGRKMFYSLAYYSRDQWSSVYDVEWYKEMKRKYDPEYAWGDLYEKLNSY